MRSGRGPFGVRVLCSGFFRRKRHELADGQTLHVHWLRIQGSDADFAKVTKMTCLANARERELLGYNIYASAHASSLVCR